MFATDTARHWPFIAAFAAGFGLLALVVDNSYYQLIMANVLVWAVMGLAWNLLSGYSGLISFGHAAFFGTGAYFVVLAQINWGLTPWLGIPLAAVIGGLAGIVVGVPTFRLRGHYFALAMLAYPLALLYVFEWLGHQEVAIPMMREAPAAWLQFDDRRVYVLIGLALAVLAMMLTRHLERSRYGMALRAIKQDETAAEAAGIDTWLWKLRAIAVSGAMSAAIGGFYAVIQLIVTPLSVFGVLVSAQALIVAMFGGVGTVWGPVIGAVTLVPLSAWLDAELGEVLPGIQGVVYGVAIIAVILLAPEGVFWKARDLMARRLQAAVPGARAGSRGESAAAAVPAAAGASFAVERPAGEAPLLEVRGMSKRFGGLRAVDGVHGPARRDRRHHRPQWRRQDHAVQPAERIHGGRQRRGRLRRGTYRRPAAEPDLRARRRPHLPGRQALRPDVDRRQRDRRRLCGDSLAAHRAGTRGRRARGCRADRRGRPACRQREQPGSQAHGDRARARIPAPPAAPRRGLCRSDRGRNRRAQ